jgi:cysteine desulfurase
MTSATPLYLDNAATTPIDALVAQRLHALLLEGLANPASQHRAGRHARLILEDARDLLKSLLLGRDCPPALLAQWELIFTSGGTEANNLALLGLGDPAAPLLVSAVEHPSVLAVAETRRAAGRPVSILPVDSHGRVVLEELDRELAHARQLSTARPLVSVMLGNNETGVLQPLEAVSACCRRHDAWLHCDAVQALGKIPLAAAVSAVDALTVSAHKIHGPVGVGALLVRSRLPLVPLLVGGSQQLGYRPGTESVALAGALATAAELALQRLDEGVWDRVRHARAVFENSLKTRMPTARVVAENAERLPHISSVAFPGADRQALLMALDLAGILCSSGSACASGSSLPSHVLKAMHLPPAWVGATLRFSFDFQTSDALALEASDRIASVVSSCRLVASP